MTSDTPLSRKPCEPVEVTAGSGNVFADLELPDPEAERHAARARLSGLPDGIEAALVTLVSAAARAADRHGPGVAEALETVRRSVRDAWPKWPHGQPMASAPRDGSAFLATGLHDRDDPPGAARGVKAGFRWWAILLFDIWREPNRFVFAKDGVLPWSEPELWCALPDLLPGDPAPHVDEAVARFGWIRDDAKSELLAAIGDGQHCLRWRNPDQIIRSGTLLGREERVSLGLERFWPALSREAWNMLTDSGRQDPRSCFEATVWRAIVNARNEARRVEDQEMLDRGSVFVFAKICGPPGAGVCPAGLTLVGQHLNPIPTFPQPDCTQPVCHCTWRLVSKFEVRKNDLR